MKEINLLSILEEKCSNKAFLTQNEKEFVFYAMKEACRQTLELVAENVGFIETTSEELNSQDYMPFIKADDNTIWTFDKQSILDTINQIK